MINAICDNLLLTAFADASKVADLDMLDEVTNDMRLEWGDRRRNSRMARLADGANESSSAFGS